MVRGDLIAACARNNFQLAESLIQDGNTPNVRHGFDQSTPLIEAVRASSLPLVNLLLGAKADVNASDRDGWTPLMLAVLAKDDVDIAEAILQSSGGVKVNQARQNRESALTLAVSKGSEELVRLLVNNGAKSSAKMPDGRPLKLYLDMMANDRKYGAMVSHIQGGRRGVVAEQGVSVIEFKDTWPHDKIVSAPQPVAALELSLKSEPNLSQLISWEKVSPLHTLCMVADEQNEQRAAALVHQMVDAGANPNMRDRAEVTPLLLACQKQLLDLAEALVENGASMELPFGRQQAHLTHLMVQQNKVTSLDLLCELGADLTAADTAGRTALHYAACEPNPELATVLLRHCCEPNVVDQELLTPLHLASMHGRAEACKELLVEHADPELEDKQGLTPLMTAAHAGQDGCVSLLISSGADVRHRDNRLKTALHWAVLRAVSGEISTAVINLLIEAGAEVEATDCLMLTPLGALINELGDHSMKKAHHPGRTQELLRAAEVLLESGAVPDVIHEAMTKTRMKTPCGGFVELLVKHGADANAEDGVGRTPLGRALEQLADPSVRESEEALTALGRLCGHLLHAGSNLQAFSEVIVAAKGDPVSERFFAMLMSHGADINHHDTSDGGSKYNDQGWTPIQEVVRSMCSGEMEIEDGRRMIDWLVSRGGDVALQDATSEGDNIIHLLVRRMRSLGRHDSAAIFRMLSKLKGSPLDMPNKRGLTPVQLAMMTDDEQMVKALLERNCEPSQLHWLLKQQGAGKLPHELMMKYAEFVIKNGASVDEVDPEGDTVFLKATLAVLNQECSQLEGTQFMELLMREGSDTTQHNAQGKNAMHLTAMGGTASCVERVKTARFLSDRANVSVDSRVAGRAGTQGAGQSTLHIACSAQGMQGSSLAGQEVGLVRFLLEAGADPNLKDEDGHTPFYNVVHQLTENPEALSAERQDALNELAYALVENGAFTDAVPMALEKAYDASQLELIALMIRNGTNLKTPVHGAPIMFNIVSEIATGALPAARYEFLTGLLHLILELGADPNVLHHVIAETQASADGYDLLEACIQHGANLEFEHPGFNYQTVLTLTVNSMLQARTMQHINGTALIKWLLHEGASINHQCGDNQRAVLHTLAVHNAEALARTILEYSDTEVDVDIMTAQGQTPLGIAAERGSEELASLLIYKYGADPDLFSGSSTPPIIAAAQAGHHAIVRMLASNGADLDVKATLSGGRSTSLLPILLSGDTAATELITYLVADLGADVTLTDSHGRSAMHYAVSKALPQIVKLLLTHGGSLGGNINRLDIEECSLLHFTLQAYVSEVKAHVSFQNELARRLDKLVMEGSLEPSSAKYMRAPQSLEESKEESRGKEKRAFYEKTIKRLFEHGADVNAGRSTLPLAVLLDNSDMLQKLLNRGARVEHVQMEQRNLVAWLLDQSVMEYRHAEPRAQAEEEDEEPERTAVQALHLSRASLMQDMAVMLVGKMSSQTVPPELLMQAVLLPVDGIIEALLNVGCSASGPPGALTTPLHMLLQALIDAEPRDSPQADRLERRALTLIRAGASLSRGDSLLFLALECGRPAVIDTLIEHGVPLDQRQNGITPVAYAFEKNSAPMTRLLLEAGANPSFVTSSGQSPLYVAYKAHNEEMVGLLTEFMDLGAEGDSIFQAIIEEVATNPPSDRLGALKQMAGGFIRRGASPNVLHRVLHSTGASQTGISFCVFLLSAEGGADPNFRHPDTNQTPLTMLIKLILQSQITKADGCEAIDMLLTQGADANTPDCDGVAPLAMAASGGAHEVVNLLQVRGAAVDLQNDAGETALLMAVRQGHKSVVATLCKRRANPNLRGGSLVPNMGPLHEACVRKDTGLVRLLLENKLLDVNARGFWGLTALHLCVGGATGAEAVDEVHIDMVEVLLGHRLIDVNIPDMDGNTILHRAELLGCSAICNITRDVEHLDETRRNNQGLTAAEVARLHRRTNEGSCSQWFSAAALQDGVPSAFAGLEEAGGVQGVRETEEHLIPELTTQQWGWPLFLGAYYGNIKEVTRVLQHAALASRVDADGRSLLHWCAIWNQPHHIEVAKLLLNSGANPFAEDSMGRTALHWAALNGSLDMMDTLRAAITGAGSSDEDAYSHVADRFGSTPEQLAAQSEFSDHQELEGATSTVRDTKFPHSLESLATNTAKLPARFMAVQWLRPAEMTDDLAGCGGALFSAVCGSEETATVERLGNDAVCVVCKHRGEEHTVYLDPYLPCIQGRPAFGSSRNDAHALYTQKAYAKLCGSYEWLLRSDFSHRGLASSAPLTSELGYKVPPGATDSHPLARLAMSHAIATAEALFNGNPQESSSSASGKSSAAKGATGWFAPVPAPAPALAAKASSGFFRDSKPQLAGGVQYLSSFTADFAGQQAEINRLDQEVSQGIKPPGKLAAGGPAQTMLIGQQPSVLIHVEEPCWVKIKVDQCGGDHSIFVNLYKDGGECWVQEASGSARQTLEGYELELYLEPSEKGYRVVTASTLATFSSEFSVSVESTAKISVEQEY